jgi:RHS repeat-associated protein
VKTGTDSVTYAYNALGDLARRSTKGHVDRWFVWEAGQLLEELDSTAQHRVNAFAYLPGTDQPLARITGDAASTIEFVQQDGRGDVIGLTNGASVSQHVLYGPWGNLEAFSGDSLPVTRLGWKGLVWEGGAAQLYYVRSRWYDPQSQSFLTEDPLGLSGGRNTYAYADNDPVNGWDPSGMLMIFFESNGHCQYAYNRAAPDIWTMDISGCAGGPDPFAFATPPADLPYAAADYPDADAPEGGGGGQITLLAVAKEVSRMTAPFSKAMDCLGHAVYAGALTVSDAAVLSDLLKGVKAARAGAIASEEASTVAMGNLFAMNPEAGSAARLAAADATAGRQEALAQVGEARKEYVKPFSLSLGAFGLGETPNLKGVAELIPGVGGGAALWEAYQSCSEVPWR